MRLLITGASGVVGQAVIEKLHSLPGIEFVCLRGQSDVNLENFTETCAVFRFVKPDKILHLAGAVFGLGGNMAFPADSYRRNTMMNCNVIEAARIVGARKVVAMGTAAIYSDAAMLPYVEDEAMVGEPHKSEYAYASAKRSMLVQLQAYQQQFGIDFAYVIATNMYGAHDRFDHRYGHVVPSLIEKFYMASKSGAVVNVWGDGSPLRDFLYSKDAADGLLLLLQSGAGAYNLASGAVRSIKELVEVIAQHFFPT